MASDSVVTPAELASGEAHVEASEWSMLAANWLVDGHDSEPLRWLASLNRAEVEAVSVADLRDVLRSIGIAIASEEDLEQRCAVALAVVQRDLDATGFNDFRMHPRERTNGSDSVRPEFVTAFANGDYTVNAEPLYPDVSDDELLTDAANAVSDTIIDVWLTSWPECTEHFGPPLSARVGGPANRPGEVHWYCSRGDHTVAPVGQLGSQVATVRGAPSRNS